MLTSLALLSALAVPAKFPTLKARDLDGHDVTVPGSYPGKALVVLMGFTRESQYVIEPWAAKAAKLIDGDDRVWVLEMPVYGWAASLARPFIDGGMKKATKPADRPHVATSTDRAAAAKGLALGSDDSEAITLVAPDGTIRFFARGALTPEKEAQFAEALASLRGELHASGETAPEGDAR